MMTKRISSGNMYNKEPARFEQALRLIAEAIFDAIAILFGAKQSNGQAEYESDVDEAVEE